MSVISMVAVIQAENCSHPPDENIRVANKWFIKITATLWRAERSRTVADGSPSVVSAVGIGAICIRLLIHRPALVKHPAASTHGHLQPENTVAHIYPTRHPERCPVIRYWSSPEAVPDLKLPPRKHTHTFCVEVRGPAEAFERGSQGTEEEAQSSTCWSWKQGATFCV